MDSTIRLFKAVPVKTNRKKNPSIELLMRTVPRGFIFSPSVIANRTDQELNRLIEMVENEFGLTAEQMNSSFHKSWAKVKYASMEQLVIEQIVHYITTYGFKSLGVYSESTVYIPNEKLEIPKLKEGITLTVINGYTEEELKEKLLNLLRSGIALKEDTVKDVVDVALFIELDDEEIATIRNKETKVVLYDFLGMIPENPVEFLRYTVYKATGKTLLIKDRNTIRIIKEKDNIDVLALFLKYKQKYGLERLAEVFYRFKPLFLAFKTHRQLNATINRIRKLAKTYHKPMERDFLNEVTAMVKRKELDPEELKEALRKANTFRKIRLANSLMFRAKNASSILYRIRNGKSYATDFHFYKRASAKRAYDIVFDSIVRDIKPNVRNKKIYIPENMSYTLPTTEKQFVGAFPSGTYVSVDKDMIAGVYWKNVDHHSIDLDMSLISPTTGKIGWDSSYRTDDRKILFSGDIVDAPRGASELFYVKRQSEDQFIVMLNYYNYSEDIDVPFKILVAKERTVSLRKNYTVNPNNVISVVKTNINKHQKIMGLLTTSPEECRFYYVDTDMGKEISSSQSEGLMHSRKYLFDFYKNTIRLRDVLEKAGARLVSTNKRCDIDLSPEALEKDTILNLMVKK